PPSGNLEQAIDILSDQLDRALGAGKQIIIMGDINVDNLVDSTEKTKIEEFLIPFNITRLNLPPTRVTRDTAKSIDWICTNIDPQQIQTSVIVSVLSDHTAQLATVHNWESVILTHDADEAYNKFHNIIQSILNYACPLKTSRARQPKKTQCWDQECTKLKDEYIKSLEMEQTTGLAEDKVKTAAKKKEYDQHLKMLRKENATDHINRA
ncbi:hypothetical protein J6590_078033, partial [Homalodisca vitripennis]